MDYKGARSDSAAARIAARQHGVVSTRQLLGIGLTRNGIKDRARAGRLHQIHQGVYAVGHRGISLHGSWMAAVLACIRVAEGRSAPTTVGPSMPAARGAALSHRSAAMLWGLLPARPGPVDVSISGDGGRKRRQGIRVHRSITLTPELITKRAGIPVTTPARTIADLRDALRKRRRGAVSERELRRAIRQAGVLGMAIETEAEPDRTRSEFEHLFLQLCRNHRLPTPEVNVRVDSLLVDFLWPDRRLIVETDGYRYHRGRAAFEQDRNRDLKLKSRGYEVIRLSYRQVTEKPEHVAAALRGLLSRQLMT
jgi:very-short-patch-repair endonuclease